MELFQFVNTFIALQPCLCGIAGPVRMAKKGVLPCDSVVFFVA